MVVDEKMSIESIDNKVDMPGNIPMFDSISGRELYLIASYMQGLQVTEGKVVFSEGEMGDYICFIISDELSIYKKAEQGKQLLISTLGKSRVLGEMNVIDSFPRSATVIAQKKSTLLTLSHERFEQILEDHRRAGISFFRGMARTLSLNLRNASGKLADALI
jgi:CRP/FNR family cyclic AMP-dependent transcriptional regulator